jgi:serine protease Do
MLACMPVSLRAQSEAESEVTTENSDPDRLLPLAFSKPVPEGIDDLRDMEAHLESLVPALSTATVGIRIGPAQGSGVIVSGDGDVLTAAHVSGRPGQHVVVILSDGERVRGTSLGRNRTLDAGLIRLEQRDEPWPYVSMADPDGIEAGDWCLATGHPGGYFEDRAPVFRLGRVILNSKRFVQTDCELVGGDSGGPLFDMHGHVIGINSRIGQDTNMNFHVPIVAFADDWERLVASESFRTHSGALLGVKGTAVDSGLQITEVYPDEPAAAAGVEVGDVLVTFNGRRVIDIDQLYDLVGQYPPGRRVNLQLVRDGEAVDVSVRLGIRWD